MSADNWAVCPRCMYRYDQRAAKLRAEADAAYGTVPVEEWKSLDAAAKKADEPFNEATFREDYAIGVDEGGYLEIDYAGGCSVCGLVASYKHSLPIEGVKA